MRFPMDMMVLHSNQEANSKFKITASRWIQPAFFGITQVQKSISKPPKN